MDLIRKKNIQPEIAEKKEVISKWTEINVNLIPPERKKEIKKRRQFAMIWRVEIILILITVIFIGILLSFRHILNINLAMNYSARVESEKVIQYEKIKNLDNQFGDINTQISNISSIKRSQLYWSNFFEKMENLVFSGISINSFTTSDYYIILTGVSDTRDDLILFKEKLEKEECFINIDLPLSNLVDKSDIEFQLDFEIKKDCLRQNEE